MDGLADSSRRFISSRCGLVRDLVSIIYWDVVAPLRITLVAD